MKILWAAPYFSEYAFLTKKALNIASVVWSKGFVKGLRDNGCDVHVITLCPEQAWPAGKVIWQNNDPKLFDSDVSVTAISYLNVAVLREKYQNFAFARAACKLMKHESFDAFVCYNVLHPYHVVAMREAKALKIPVYPIVLDGGYNVGDRGFDQMSRDARYADGVVFLSQWCCDNFPANNRRVLQMEGGVPGWRGGPPSDGANNFSRPKIITYAGAFNPHRGQALVDLVKFCTRADVRFVFCGKWNVESARKVFGNDSRVVLRGMVSHEEIQRIYAETDVFINSREINWGHNLANFPSKVLAYLGYGRPIVSNWNESYPKEYREILEVSADDTGQSLASKLSEVLDWSFVQKRACYDKLYSAFDVSKSWTRQTERFLDFIREVKT